jgi:hypothetical protein
MPLGSLPDVIVLVEGRSDAAAVAVLLAARGLDLDGRVEVVSMEGVTNAARELARVRHEHPESTVLGLYDAAEERFVVGALRRAGIVMDGRADLAAHGFFVCDGDLEDELIRAVGAAGVEDALDELGQLERFRTFQYQPEWRGRPLTDQLHRFAGSGSGRKAALAERLALRLDPTDLPPPLAALLDRIEQASTRGLSMEPPP